MRDETWGPRACQHQAVTSHLGSPEQPRAGAAGSDGVAGAERPQAPDPGPLPAVADLADFASMFQQFLREMVSRSREHTVSLAEQLKGLTGAEDVVVPTLSRTFDSFELANIQLALDALGRDHGGYRTAGMLGMGRYYRTYSELLTDPDYQFGPLDYRSVQISPNEELTCLSCAMVAFDYRGDWLLVWLRGGDPDDPKNQANIEVICPDPARAEQFLAEFEAQMLAHNVFRGKVVSIQPHLFSSGVGPLRFLEPSRVRREDVILPPGLLDRVERQVFGVARQREYLLARGQHLKRGLLFYGPPGTGKTHLINYLLTQLPDFTTVIVSGIAVERIGEACAMARKLHPALVVVEDVDLIAEDRGARGGSQPLMMQLLNELDGVGAESDIAFILTTNQVEVLERALAARPGRIDLAVEVPLPDAGGRRKLFHLYAAGLGLPEEELDRLADRAVGVTASFAKEATRRAVLIAGERGSDEVTVADFDLALDELLDQRDELIRRLMGSRIAGEYASGESRPGNYV